MLENTINTQKEENSALQRQFSKLELELTKKTDNNNILQERLEDKKEEVETLKQQLKNAQDNLDHYRETIRQTRETENNLLNEQIKSLERQLYQQQTIASKATEETTILLKQLKGLEDTKKTILQDINEALANLQEQKNVMQRQTLVHNELSEKYNNVLSDNSKLTNELKTEKEASAWLKINLEKAQERIIMLDDALNKAESKVVIISDQNLFLTQEKTELAFQLKQLQSCKQ